MTKGQIYYHFFIMFALLWFSGYFSTARLEGNFQVSIPSFLSRILFIKKLKKKIMVQSLLLQIWVYIMTISLLIGYRLRFFGNVYRFLHLYSRFLMGTLIVYFIITLPDVIVYTIKNKGKLF